MGRKVPGGSPRPRRVLMSFLSRRAHQHSWPCHTCTAAFDFKAEVEEHELARHP